MRIDGRLDGNTQRDSSHPDIAGGQSQDARRGSFRGDTIMVVPDELSRLDNAKEEMSLHFSEKVESKVADEQEVQAEPVAQVMRAEEILEYLATAQAFQSPADLVALAKRFLATQQSPRQLARQASQDPTQQYLLLQLALHEGEASGAPPERLAALREALAELDFESGAAIQAGFNSIDAAAGFGSTATQISRFQNTYRDVVLGASSLMETLKLALERFGEQDFARGLKSLLQALGADIAATRPSVAPVRLQMLVADVYQLEVFNTLLDETSRLARSLESRHGISNFPALNFVKDLVAFTADRWITATRFLDIPERLHIALLAARIEILTQGLRVLREMPVKVYPDADTRWAVLGAGQDALDQIIETEDETGEDEPDDHSTAQHGDGNSPQRVSRKGN